MSPTAPYSRTTLAPIARRSATTCLGRPVISMQAFVAGAGLGVLIGLIPLFDFLARSAREGLVSYSFVQVRESPPGVAQKIALVLILCALPIAVAAWRCDLDFRRAGLFPIVALANVTIVSASLIGLPASTLIYVALVTYCFSLAALVSAFDRSADEFMEGFLSAVGVVLAGVFCLVIWDANYSYGRLMGRSGPNYWGMVAIAATFGALALRSAPLRVAILSIAVFTIYLCQSRGTMLAVGSGCGILWLLHVYHASHFRRLVILGATLFVALAAIIVFGDFIATKLLLLDNRGRGLESGGTGRVGAWEQTFELFSTSPWLGVGYRQHESFITAASSSHNAYLASLADTGIVGFAAYLALMFGATVLAIRKAIIDASQIAMAVAGLSTSFLVIGCVERVGINTGNTLSLVMIFSAAWAYRTGPAPQRAPTRALTKRQIAVHQKRRSFQS